MATIFITTPSIMIISIKRVHDLPHSRMGLPGLPNVVIEISNVMTWFVAMRILTNQPGDICLFSSRSLALRSKERVKFICKLRSTAHQFDQPSDVLRCKETVLPGICFGKTKVYF